MKRTGIIIAFILTLAFAGLFSSCKITGQNPSDTVKPAESVAPSADQEAPDTVQPTDGVQTIVPVSTPAAGFVFEDKTYKNGTVSIKYPQITGMADRTAQEKLNKFIADAALRDKDSLESGTEYELNYKITRNSPSIISIYFEGYSNVPGTAHPNQFLYTVTIDAGKQEPVKLPALVTINKAFIDVLLNGKISSMSYDMTSEYASAIKQYLTELGDDYWISELQNADTNGYATSSYLTEDALVVSVSVPHALGDHVEITLPYKDLRSYQTDNPLWKTIEG